MILVRLIQWDDYPVHVTKIKNPHFLPPLAYELMPILIVGLGAALVCTNAMALTDIMACADCYCCDAGTQGACYGSCYYDTSCCMSEDCTVGYHWDSILRKCVEDDDTEIRVCMSGMYPTDTGCEPCPEPADFSPTKIECSVTSTDGEILSNNSGIVSSLSIETCYMPMKYYFLDGGGTCEYTDASGTFELSQNCNYSAKLSIE